MRRHIQLVVLCRFGESLLNEPHVPVAQGYKSPNGGNMVIQSVFYSLFVQSTRAMNMPGLIVIVY